MYNRYVRDADGNYQRQIMQKAPPEPQQKSRPPEPTKQQKEPHTPTKPCRPGAPPLFPMSLETGDLLVLLVLVLILTEGEESDKTALLITMAAFLMMQ